ncbi:Cytoskeletal-regulatory complex EF hand family protein [Babesia bovis T2Bo]|uniref:EF hand domain conatining protein n=1 Tax=Babesia bovis TaxID=5865 RepID=A7AV00_BABBO|nr:Cytoskeletal-regulatory complex EF hand family protein [Babesia bovis T2Bo]EDO05626.1 Cytoskeletal-regulatory complex EF hand family protein [Babesia bovis T2Bo]|eukprot:XP_001609194.1 EF hand domain conatining protein [Babesia bovis T2Bo]
MADPFVESRLTGWRTQLHDTCMKHLTLSPAQDDCFRKLFLRWDRRGFGSMDGDNARRLFRTAGLPDEILFDIWSVADIDGTGELDYRAFCICCVLIAHAQMNPELLSHVDWLMDMDFVNRVASGVPMSEYLPYFDLEALDICERGEMPDITPDEAMRYEKLFYTLDRDGDGYLEGQDVREYYIMRNELNDEELLRIWEIADADVDGRLTMKEFMVMEHLVHYSISKANKYSQSRLMHSQHRDDGFKLSSVTKDYEQVSSVNGDVHRSGMIKETPHDLNSTRTTEADNSSTKQHAKELMPIVTESKPETEHQAYTKPAAFNDSTVGEEPEMDVTDSTKIKDHAESLKLHVADLEAEVEKLRSENSQLMAMYNQSEERIEQLHALHKMHAMEMEAEQAALRKEERELNELQDRIKSLRREKLKHESEQQALRDALMHTEDAEQTMLRSVRSEHSKVTAIRGERIQTMRTTIELLESLHPAINSPGTQKPTMRAINDRNVVHDSKGIRVTAAESVMERRLNPHMSSRHNTEWAQKQGEVYQG